MPYRQSAFAPGNIYRLYNRGANRQPIFFGTDNYEYCLGLVKKYRGEHQVSIIAYCLMPNHYHFVLRQNGDVPLSSFMQVVFNAYTQAVNRQQNRKGTLFEGCFKHLHVDDTAYFLHLCRYVHLNPVAAGLVQSPADWLYSNYLEWIGVRKGSLIDRPIIEALFPLTDPPEGSKPSGGSVEIEYARFVTEYQADKETQAKLARYLFDE